MSREQVKAVYVSAHPAENKQKVAASVGQVYRFAHSMTQGSTIVMYNPAEQLYHIGTIEGPCTPANGPKPVTYTRAVSWHETAPRDLLAPASKNSLSSISCETGMSAGSSYPIVALCLSSSESASFERAPETMSWIQT